MHSSVISGAIVTMLTHLLRPSFRGWPILAPAAAVMAILALLGPPQTYDLVLAAALTLVAAAARGQRSLWLGAIVGAMVGGALSLGPAAWAIAAFAGGGLVLPWIWEGERAHLRQSSVFGLAAALVALAVASATAAPVLGAAWALAMLCLEWLDRRWPVDCVYCRSFRAAIAASCIPAAAVLLWPSAIEVWPAWTGAPPQPRMMGLPILALIGAFLAFRQQADLARVFAACLLGLALLLPLAVFDPERLLAVQILALPPALWLAATVVRRRWRA